LSCWKHFFKSTSKYWRLLRTDEEKLLFVRLRVLVSRSISNLYKILGSKTRRNCYYIYTLSQFYPPSILKYISSRPSSMIFYFRFYRTIEIAFSLWVTKRRFQYREYIASDGRVTDKWWIRKELEGSGPGLIEVLSWNLHGIIEGNHNNFSKNSQCIGRDLNR
jgi:hypothetical protein